MVVLHLSIDDIGYVVRKKREKLRQAVHLGA